MVRSKAWTFLWALIFGVVCGAAQRGPAGSAGEQFLGTWTGTWDGAGSSGGFDLTLERTKDGAVGGKVSVTGDPTYEARLTEIAFDGKKMTAKYDFTPQPQAEVVLVATFDGKTATGTWSLREKASGSEVVSGSWNVTRK